MGTILIGVVNCICAALSVFTVRKYKRKTLVMLGHIIMGFLLTLVGVFSILEYGNLMLGSILLFLAAF